MREADILLQGLADGQVSSLPQSQAAQQAPEPPPGFEVRCDVNGCSIVKVASDYSSQVGFEGWPCSNSQSSVCLGME